MPRNLNLLFCGSFKFYDEMKKLSRKLDFAGVTCILPKFSLGKNLPSREIEKIKENRKEDGLRDGEFKRIVKVSKWFYDRLRNCDAIIVFDKNGYVGLSVAAEIGAAYALEKPVFFLEMPKDYGIRALLNFSENFKVVPIKTLINELRKLQKH